MIPRLNRLPSAHLASSQTISAPLFILKAAVNNLSYPRFAFVVGKRVDKKAVVRNRLKRVLREIAFEKTLPYAKGVDLLFIVRKNFITLPHGQVEEMVVKAIENAIHTI